MAAPEDNKQDEQGANASAAGDHAPSAPSGAATPPHPAHPVKHQPTRYKATGTAPVYGMGAPSRHHKKMHKPAPRKQAPQAQQAHSAGQVEHGQTAQVGQAPHTPSVPPAYIPAGTKPNSKPHGHRDRSPVPVIALCVLVLACGLGIGWAFFWRSVNITVNNEAQQVRIGTSLDAYLADNDYFGVKAGKLLSVGGNTLSEDGGDRCSVTRDGNAVAVADLASTKIEDGDTITVTDGADATEEYTEEEVAIAPGITKEAGGAIQYVSQWGKAGKKKVWTGKQSGETVDKEIIEEATQMVVSSRTPSPSDGGKYIALTFDDGPSGYTQDILNILAEKGVKATFFNLGTQAEGKPDLTKAVVEGGHELASHTNQHQNLPTLGKDDLRNEITSAFDKLTAASGTTTQMIRAPYGAFTDVEWARSADLISCNVLWNIDTLDWKLPGASAITNMVLTHAFNGAIALMHDGGGNRSQDVEALPGIIDGLKAAGYQLVTVSELMKLDGNFPEDVVNGTVKMPDDAVLPDV